MGGDEPEDGLAGLTFALPCGEARLAGRRIGRIGHPEVSAQHVDTHLTLLVPLVGESSHGVRARHPGRWLI